MKQAELNQILELHEKWLRGESGGVRADLRNADLRYANLRYADLRNADLRNADLRYASLRNADLRYANLRYADLRYADLRYADLNGADLRYANTLLLLGMTIIECQLNTSEQNRRISYWKDLDIVTAGCYQGTWLEFKERVQQVHGDNPVMKRKYDRVIAFIEAEAEEEEE